MATLYPFLRKLIFGSLAFGASSGAAYLVAVTGLAPSLRNIAERGLDMSWRVILLLICFMLLEIAADHRSSTPTSPSSKRTKAGSAAAPSPPSGTIL